MKNRKLLLTRTFFWMVALVFSVNSCVSIDEGKIFEEKYNLKKIPIKTKRLGARRSNIDLIEYQLETKDIIKSVEKGRVDLFDNLKYSQRRLFTITDTNFRSIDAETLMTYSKEGFDRNGQETSTFYGRTSQADFPFTISMVANQKTKIFSGKSKRLNTILDISGTPYTSNNFLPYRSEIGFLIEGENGLLSYLSLIGVEGPTIYIKQDMDRELRKTVLFTVSFLLQFQRYVDFPVNPSLVRGE